MHIETLKSLIDLLDTASFQKAAHMNGITQSAVSQQVKLLESIFSTELVNRKKHGRGNCEITPTAAGAELLDASRKIVSIWTDLIGRLNQERFAELELEKAEGTLEMVKKHFQQQMQAAEYAVMIAKKKLDLERGTGT